VSITEDTLVVHDKREPLELPILNSKLHQELIEALIDEAKELRTICQKNSRKIAISNNY
jgi:hypothetical protein